MAKGRNFGISKYLIQFSVGHPAVTFFDGVLYFDALF